MVIIVSYSGALRHRSVCGPAFTHDLFAGVRSISGFGKADRDESQERHFPARHAEEQAGDNPKSASNQKRAKALDIFRVPIFTSIQHQACAMGYTF